MLSRISLNRATKAVTKSHFFIKNQSTNRSLHIICQCRVVAIPNFLNCKANVKTNFNRHASTDVLDTFQIPAPPIVPVITNEPSLLAANISEVTQAGLGTAWTPVSLVEHSLDFLHASVGLPWWASIAAVTIVARLACFPLVIKAQKNTIKMSEYLPEFQEIQKKLSFARKARDLLAVERYSHEISVLMRGREFDVFKSLTPQLMQGAVALSVFFALKAMTAAPLKSMEDGGLWWFTNLCIPDPHLLLPIMSSTTLMLILYSASKMMPMPVKVKKILIAGLPCLTFFIIKSFPAGTLVYWVTTNSITLCQHRILKIKAVKNYFGLQDMPQPNQISPNISTSFTENFRESMSNMKVAQQVHERTILKDLEKKRIEKIIKASERNEAPKAARKDRSV